MDISGVCYNDGTLTKTEKWFLEWGHRHDST
jgi:hypothetical protein